MVLAFIACSLMAGNACKEVQVPLMPEVNSHQCMLFGQMEIAKWVRDNPNWCVGRGYKCGRAQDFVRA